MPQSKLPRKQELKTASDFEQWLSEINLFAHETQAELHEVAGVLNLALASDHHRELEVGNRLSTSSPLESAIGTPGESTSTSDSEGDDYLASLQHKLSKQLKSKRTLAFPTHANPTANQTNTKGQGGRENDHRDIEPNGTDPSF